jgi:Zn-dependent peptidase ImmA (M78 family)
LIGCEATLVGYGSKAIATIRRSTSRGRERFSIAHELGHWDMHRGQSFRCRVEDPSDNLSSDRAKEQDADSYAAHMLMPSWLFNPAIRALGNPGFNKLQEIADHFETSLIATSLRVVDVHKLPAFVACFRGDKRRWFKRSDDIPKRWWLRSTLDDDSFSYDLLKKGKAPASPGKQPAEVWFENDDAEQYELLEHCVQRSNGDILVVLYLTDSEMLDARFDPNVGVKKYDEHGVRYTEKRRG